MSEHRSAVTRSVGSSVPRRRRWLIGAVGALGASGLILGGVGVPVSADDVNAGGNPSASATVHDGCVTAAVGTGEAVGSVHPQGDDGQVQAAGDGTATVSVCVDDPGGPPSGDPGGSVPGDLDDVVPDDLGGSPAGEVVGAVTGALDGELPGDGDGSPPADPGDLPGIPGDVDPGEGGGVIPGDPGGPGDDLPGDLGDVLPGGIGGLVPDGSGIDPGGLLDRLVDIIPASIDDGETPGGNGGAKPAVNASGNGSVSGPVAAGGEGTEGGGHADVVLGTELERDVPSSVGTAVSPAGSLPRTGGGLGTGVLRLLALLGLGRAVLVRANRRDRRGIQAV